MYIQAPGSLLGFKEFQINYKRIQDGLKRTRDNARLEEEIEKEEMNRL